MRKLVFLMAALPLLVEAAVLEPVEDIPENGLPLWSQVSFHRAKGLKPGKWMTADIPPPDTDLCAGLLEGARRDCEIAYGMEHGESGVAQVGVAIKHYLIAAFRSPQADAKAKLIEYAAVLASVRMSAGIGKLVLEACAEVGEMTKCDISD